jgi:hypothetical protein
MRSACALVLLLLAGVVAACGGGGESEEDQVRSAIDQYSEALRSRDGSGLCGVIVTRELLAASQERRSRELDRCRGRATGDRLSGAPQLGDVRVQSVRVRGPRAAARVRVAGHPERIELARVDGDWRIVAPGG